MSYMFQWLYLSMVFDENIGAYQKTVLARFEEVDRRFKVMSVSNIQPLKIFSQQIIL